MHKRLNKPLVANHGEIVVRAIRAAQALGVPTIAVCSGADRDSLAARSANETCLTGPTRTERSYLDIEAILMAAREIDADSTHPGCGFPSENPAFAEVVQVAGLVFVGLDAQTTRRVGDKAKVRYTVMTAGVPVMPGSPGGLNDLDAALACAEEVGYPLLVKVSAGGGGHGIRITYDADGLCRESPITQCEARTAFGSSAMYLERFIRQAWYIEVQILGGGERVVHLFERECPLQRRRQKVFEETSLAALGGVQRRALCESAVRPTQSLGYRGAGTLEYLLDTHSGEFSFIGMSTRTQVGHPVSEMVTGINLVQAMLCIAAGEALPQCQEDIRLNGTALEIRISAEDPARNFLPSPGTVERLEWPQDEGVRVNSHLYPDYRAPLYYDSLLAKLIAHGRNRDEAFARAYQALERTVLVDVAITLPLYHWLLVNAWVQATRFNTATLEAWLAERTAVAQEV